MPRDSPPLPQGMKRELRSRCCKTCQGRLLIPKWLAFARPVIEFEADCRGRQAGEGLGELRLLTNQPTGLASDILELPTATSVSVKHPASAGIRPPQNCADNGPPEQQDTVLLVSNTRAIVPFDTCIISSLTIVPEGSYARERDNADLFKDRDSVSVTATGWVIATLVRCVIIPELDLVGYPRHSSKLSRLLVSPRIRTTGPSVRFLYIQGPNILYTEHSACSSRVPNMRPRLEQPITLKGQGVVS